MIAPRSESASRVGSWKQPRRLAIAKSKPKDTRRSRTPPLKKAAARLEAARIAVEVVNPATRDAPRFRQLERRLALSRTDLTDDGQILSGVTPLYETAHPPRYSVRIDRRVPRDEILASLDRLFARNAPRWTKARAARPGYRPAPAEFHRGILSFDQLTARTALRREARALLQASAPKALRSRFRPRESDLYHRAAAYIAAERRAGHLDPNRRQLARKLDCSEDQARRALEYARGTRPRGTRRSTKRQTDAGLLRRYGVKEEPLCRLCKNGRPCPRHDRPIDESNDTPSVEQVTRDTPQESALESVVDRIPAQAHWDIREAIFSLSDEDQRLLSLRYAEGCSDRQAAAEMQLPETDYRQRLEAAEARLPEAVLTALNTASRKGMESP